MLFRFLTSGESHGSCLNAIIDGVPAGFSLTEEFINKELKRRQVGYGRGGRMAIESDSVKILSGVRFGQSTGAPVSLQIVNKDWENWQIPMSVGEVEQIDENLTKINDKTITKLRPGHADFSGCIKYSHNDVRNILERSSARETATRVAVGAVAKAILADFGIDGFSHVVSIGRVQANCSDLNPEKIEASDLRCADEQASALMKQEIDLAKENGDTLGGSFEVVFNNLPVGLGSFVHWDRKLDGLLAQAVMSIPAVKSVEFGLGASVSSALGSETHDEIFYENSNFFRKTNNAGGLDGGMTNGESLVIRASMKAIPTMQKPLKSVCLKSHEPYEAHFERSDTCAVPACAVVAEAMVAIVLLDAFMEKFGHDSKNQMKSNYDAYLADFEKR